MAHSCTLPTAYANLNPEQPTVIEFTIARLKPDADLIAPVRRPNLIRATA